MLYDPNWESKTEVEPLSLAGLIAWLEKQPADTEYDWPNVHGCLVCNYVTAIGRYEGTVYAKLFSDIEQYYRVAAEEPWTYGAALERARAELR